MDEAHVKKWQKKILLLCWCAYAGAYLCRSNLSIALPDMITAEGWNKTSAGLIGSMFFWAYAVGQLVNGIIGDRIKAKSFIFIGLCIASIANLLISFSENLTLIMVFWCINGFSLSMLWGPIIRTVSLWLPPVKRTKAAMFLASSMIAGYFLAWGAIGLVIVYMPWQWAFQIPSAVVLIYALFWLKEMKNRPEDIGIIIFDNNAETFLENNNDKTPDTGFIRLILDTRLWIIAVACMAQGVIKDSIVLWAPTFISDTQNINQGTLPLVSLAIPLISSLGIFSVGHLSRMFPGNDKKSISLLSLCSAISSLLLYFFFRKNMILSIILLSITLASMQGANTFLLALIRLYKG